jgi:L-threonylcarbamoyladenylate synthase
MGQDWSMTERIDSSEDGLAAAAALLREGALVAFPTDTVYGIGCRVGDGEGLDRLFEAKRRPTDKRIPILLSGLGQARELGYLADERVEALASAFWPGPLTLILPDAAGGATQAFRAPDHPVALDLITRSGPLAATSANRSGEPETYEADDVLVAFADTELLAAVVDGGRVPGGVASTVLDTTGERPRILRPGPVTREDLAAVVGHVD